MCVELQVLVKPPSFRGKVEDNASLSNRLMLKPAEVQITRAPLLNSFAQERPGSALTSLYDAHSPTIDAGKLRAP